MQTLEFMENTKKPSTEKDFKRIDQANEINII
jgi:hypothetical protein